MTDTLERRDPKRADAKDRQAPAREPAEAREAEWVLEQIQQTFDTRRD